jgi:hypothetical protein
MADEVPWRPTLRRKSPFRKPVRPFSPFVRIREQQPNHLEVERFEVFGPTRAEDAWLRRRRHAPLDLRVPAAWNLDAIYLRHAEERSYWERLHKLQLLPCLGAVSVRLVCFCSEVKSHLGSRLLTPVTRLYTQHSYRHPEVASSNTMGEGDGCKGKQDL